MKSMQLGDLAFFYHSTEEKQIVGIIEIVKLYYPDPTDETGRFGMVDVKAVKPLPYPVPLGLIKTHPKLQNMPIIKQSRLSVSPVTPEEWKTICTLGGV